LLAALLQTPEGASDQERVLKVIRQLTKHVKTLPSALPKACLDAAFPSAHQGAPATPGEKPPAAEEVAFLDRQQVLNQIRQFVNNRDQRAFVLGGMRGIGKTTVIRRVFVEVLPRWRCFWIPVSEGMSFEGLIGECANRFDFPLTGIPSTPEARELSRAVIARTDSLEATALVLDDCQNLLSGSGDFREPAVLGEFSCGLSVACSARGAPVAPRGRAPSREGPYDHRCVH
jgi:hypothetical protein